MELTISQFRNEEKGIIVADKPNIPLDAHIIADTDYLRQYLEMCPYIILDGLDTKNPDDAALAKVLSDTDDPLFEKVVDRIVEKAVEDDRLRALLAETVHNSWLWEQLSDMCDDVSVAFMHSAARETLAEMKLGR